MKITIIIAAFLLMTGCSAKPLSGYPDEKHVGPAGSVLDNGTDMKTGTVRDSGSTANNVVAIGESAAGTGGTLGGWSQTLTDGTTTNVQKLSIAEDGAADGVDKTLNTQGFVAAAGGLTSGPMGAVLSPTLTTGVTNTVQTVSGPVFSITALPSQYINGATAALQTVNTSSGDPTQLANTATAAGDPSKLSNPAAAAGDTVPSST